MTLENILKLLDAGYTKEEINAMCTPAPAPAPAPAPEPAPAPAPEPAPAPAPAPETPKYLTADDLVKVIQAMNIQNAQRTEPPVQTAEDIIASVIMPGKKG